MDILAVKDFFMWCSIINIGLMCLTGLVCTFLSDFSYKVNSMLFSISRETFNIAILSFIGLYKLFVIVFNIVPYIALVIIG